MDKNKINIENLKLNLTLEMRNISINTRQIGILIFGIFYAFEAFKKYNRLMYTL